MINMAQHQDLNRSGDVVQSTGSDILHVPPPVNVELLKNRSDLPNKSTRWSNVQLPVDILLLTVEDCEFLACYAHLRNSFRSYLGSLFGFVYFGTVGESGEDCLKVALMRCCEDSCGPGGSLVTVKNAVSELRPKAIFSVGSCMGLNPEVTSLGDVIVSSYLYTTEGLKTPVGRDIMHLGRHAGDGWTPPLSNVEDHNVQVFPGKVFSGMDLAVAKQQCLSHFTEDATAFEKGGGGLFVAALDLKIEWAIVKGISHFSNNDSCSSTEKSWKSYACVMAASVVSNMLKNPVVFKQWPHYEDPLTMRQASGADKEGLPDSLCLEECQKQLRSIYEARNKVKIVPWDQSSSLHIDKVYTQLSWLRDEKNPSGVTQEEIEHYTDIFDGGRLHRTPKRILIHGRPVIGKTVFTQKATFDWSQHRFKGKLGRFDLVLLVKLRDVCGLQDVPAILWASKLLASDGLVSSEDLYDYVRRHQEKVLLILDGYDEYVYSANYNQSPVREIWEKKQLRDCCVVITSRDMQVEVLKNCSEAEFQIDGFDRDRQVEFSRRFLRDDQDVAEFIKYLEQQELKDVAKIPLLLLMLCLVWKEKDYRGLPSSRAMVYFQFIQTLFDHMASKEGDARTFRDVNDYKKELCKIGELAFDALLQDSLYLPVNKLPDHVLTTKLIEAGLFQLLNMSALNPCKAVHFIHKSFKEYLASFFLTEELSTQKDKKKSLFKVDSVEKIFKMIKVFKFAIEMSEEAAREILLHVTGMAAKKDGLTAYSFDNESPSTEDLSEEQRNYLDLCTELFFCCSADTRKELFPTFLSSLGGVLVINPKQLNVIVTENLLKTAAPLMNIFFSESKEYTEQDYRNLITLTQQLNAVIVSRSGEIRASEFLKKYSWRSVDEFFLKKEIINTYLYFSKIVKGFPDGFPFEMINALISLVEATNKTMINSGGESSEQACSTHALSRVWRIEADCVNKSEVELLSDVLPFLLAPQEIVITGEDDAEWDSDVAKKILIAINRTHRLKKLTLHGLTEEQVQHLTEETMKTELYTDYHDHKGNPRAGLGWSSDFSSESSGNQEQTQMGLVTEPHVKPEQVSTSSPSLDTRPSSRDAPSFTVQVPAAFPADSIPASVRARGDKALAAYHRALETGGSTYDKRVKILVVGQDRVGKTSLSKALRGEPFDETELSTDGVQMMPAVKNAGTGPWRNPASLEHATVYDHKIANKTAELLFSTREEQPANREPTATTGNRQKPTETITNRQKPTETSTVKRPHEPKAASNKTVQSSFGGENPVHQEKKVLREIQKNENQDPTKYQEKPFHFPQEEEIPVNVALVLEENLQKNEIDSDENIWPVVWDFAGQDVYRAVHPIFMSSEDIYLLVFDLTKRLSEKAICRVNVGHKEHTVTARDSEDTNLDHLLRWMDLIHSLKKDVQDVEDSYTPVILVGTHADCVDDPRKEMEVVKKTLRKELGEAFLRHIVGQLPIDNKNAVDQEEIIKLRNLILESANEMPQTKKKIPLQWHLVEKKILTEPVWQRKKYLKKESFRKKLRENVVTCRFEDEDDFDELVYFLHGRGTIVYYEHKHADQKEGLIFLDPQWLIYLLCQIIKVIPDENEPLWVEEAREKLGKEGVLSERLINRTCKNEKVDLIESYLISLMDEFNLICKWPEKTGETTTGGQRFLVPCMLSSCYEEENEEIDFRAPIYLNFETEYVPSGLFCRLVVLFGKTPHLENTHELHANEAKFALDNENHVLQLLCYKKVIKLRISAGPHGISQGVYDNIVSQLNLFLERLRKECHWLHSMSVTFRARCTLCIKTTPCHRHEKSSCGHHDCSHYISLDATSLSCKPGKLLEVEPLEPWILAVKKLKPSWSRPNSHSETRPSQGIVKKGVVHDDDLEGLSLQLGSYWKPVARRLDFIEADIDNFNHNNPTCPEKQLKMLQSWKQKLGSGATYQVLYDALCHGHVNRKYLAQMFCIDNTHVAESSASVNSSPQCFTEMQQRITLSSPHLAPSRVQDPVTVRSVPVPRYPAAGPISVGAPLPLAHSSSHHTAPFSGYTFPYSHTHHHRAPSTIFTPGGTLDSDSYPVRASGLPTHAQDGRNLGFLSVDEETRPQTVIQGELEYQRLSAYEHVAEMQQRITFPSTHLAPSLVQDPVAARPVSVPPYYAGSQCSARAAITSAHEPSQDTAPIGGHPFLYGHTPYHSSPFNMISGPYPGGRSTVMQPPGITEFGSPYAMQRTPQPVPPQSTILAPSYPSGFGMSAVNQPSGISGRFSPYETLRPPQRELQLPHAIPGNTPFGGLPVSCPVTHLPGFLHSPGMPSLHPAPSFQSGSPSGSQYVQNVDSPPNEPDTRS